MYTFLIYAVCYMLTSYIVCSPPEIHLPYYSNPFQMLIVCIIQVEESHVTKCV